MTNTKNPPGQIVNRPDGQGAPTDNDEDERIINLWEDHGLPPCNTYSQVLFARAVLSSPPSVGEPPSNCTCHPDDRPQECHKKFAASECIATDGAKPAGEFPFLEKIDTLIASVNEAHHAKSDGWRDGCFAAADAVYAEIKAALAAAPESQRAPKPVAFGSKDGYWVRAEDLEDRPDKDEFTEAFYAPRSDGAQAAGQALQALLDHVDRETCRHETTHRGGAIWTICDDCGQKWADDRGGFKPYEDAPAVAKARAILAAGGRRSD